MRFKPLTEQEIQESMLVPEGQYSFEVLNAQEKTSKAGAQMIELKLRIYDQNGKSHVLFDYLLEAMKFKLLHFTKTTGLEELYNSGNLNADNCIGKQGYCDIIIRKDNTGQYSPKNSVKDYIDKQFVKINNEPSTKQIDEFNDEIPF